MEQDKQWNWAEDRFFTSDHIFRDIFTLDGTAIDPAFKLPRRHKECFESELRELFERYNAKIKTAVDGQTFTKGTPYELIPWEKTKRVQEGIMGALRHLHNGYPSEAYNTFERMMDEFSIEVPLPHVRDTIWPSSSVENKRDLLSGYQLENSVTTDAAMAETFYRVRGTSYGSAYPRSAIFHTPANLREKISTARYSIAGYPSLYLADTLSLSMQELGSPYHSIAASFALKDRSEEVSSVLIIDLGVRPQDFIFQTVRGESSKPHNKLDEWYTSRYVFWFPLLAACSYIRENPTSSYSDEYAIPQLLMQWIRLNKKPPYGMKYPDDPTSGGGTPPPSPNSGPSPTPLPPDEKYDELQELLVNASLTLDLSDIEKGAVDSRPPTASDRIRMIELADAIKATILELVRLTLSAPGLIFSEFLYTLLRINSRSINYLIDLIKREGGKESSELARSIRRMLSQLEKYPALLKGIQNRQNGDQGNSPSEDAFEKRLLETLQYIKRLISWLDDYRVMGIRYFSCKDLYAPLLGRNYVFPSERIILDANGEIADESEAQFSSQLNRLFVWGVPQHREDYKDIQTWQRGLDEELKRNPGSLGSP